MEDKVTVVTPVHNAEEFLRQCIESVLSQTYEHWEHILVDDCSTDNSATIIKKYAKEDNRIKYHRLRNNSGAGIARNKAIENAKGNYIAFLDSDDTWYPDKLELQLNFMLQNQYYFSFTSYDTMDLYGNKLNKIFQAKKRVTYKSALFKNPIGCLTAMFSVDYFGKQYMPAIRKRQDFALWLRLLKKTDAHGLQKCLSSYRVGNKSISSNKIGLLKYEWKIYREEEDFSILKSLFYLFSAIVLKMKSYI